jgi:hypothetical protein
MKEFDQFHKNVAILKELNDKLSKMIHQRLALENELTEMKDNLHMFIEQGLIDNSNHQVDDLERQIIALIVAMKKVIY